MWQILEPGSPCGESTGSWATRPSTGSSTNLAASRLPTPSSPRPIRRTFGNGKPINSVPDARGKIRDTGPTTCAIDWDETLERNPQSPDPTKQAVIDLKERGKIGDVLVQWAVTWIEDSDDEDVDDTKDAKIDIYCVVGLSSKNRPQVRRFRHRTYAEAVREWRTDSSRIPLGGPRAEQIAEQVREKLEALKADPAFPVR